MRADFRTVDQVTVTNRPAVTAKSFVIEEGRPGVQPVRKMADPEAPPQTIRLPGEIMRRDSPADASPSTSGRCYRRRGGPRSRLRPSDP
jgi:hypothetical protein